MVPWSPASALHSCRYSTWSDCSTTASTKWCPAEKSAWLSTQSWSFWLDSCITAQQQSSVFTSSSGASNPHACSCKCSRKSHAGSTSAGSWQLSYTYCLIYATSVARGSCPQSTRTIPRWNEVGRWVWFITTLFFDINYISIIVGIEVEGSNLSWEDDNKLEEETCSIRFYITLTI